MKKIIYTSFILLISAYIFTSAYADTGIRLNGNITLGSSVIKADTNGVTGTTSFDYNATDNDGADLTINMQSTLPSGVTFTVNTNGQDWSFTNADATGIKSFGSLTNNGTGKSVSVNVKAGSNASSGGSSGTLVFTLTAFNP